jgi:tRNA threonylcarbamoyladenosine biosynthesis protein TsaE
MKRLLHNETETLALASEIYPLLEKGEVVFLYGELGAGKTTFVRACLRQAGFSGPVKSPTFTLVEEYSLPDRMFYHFDLYRLIDPEELEWIGFRDYLGAESLCFIEWPERGMPLLPTADLEIRLTLDAPGRWAELTANTEKGRTILARMGSQSSPLDGEIMADD